MARDARVRWIVRVPGLKTLRRSGIWLRSRILGGAVVLGYHRVASSQHDPFGLCVSPRHFAEHLEIIRRVATPLPLAELVVRAGAGRLPRRTLSVTFDDAYQDVLDVALPLLRDAGVPATVFAVSDLLGTTFWWDRLAAVDRMRRIEANGGTDWDISSVHLDLRSLPAEERDRQVRMWERDSSVVGAELPRCMTRDGLRELGSDPLIAIGGHTRTHPWLPSLGEAARRAEIVGCKRELEETLEKEITAFSFPYGGVSPELRAEVSAAGYAFACDSHGDVVNRRTDRFAIPRFWPGDQDGRAFDRWLGRWLNG